MPRIAIHTEDAPAAIGPYSQAVRSGRTVYLSGQIPLDPATGELAGGGFDAQVRRAFDNLAARKPYWIDTLRMIRDFPITGTGLNTYGIAMLHYQSPSIVGEVTR